MTLIQVPYGAAQNNGEKAQYVVSAHLENEEAPESQAIDGFIVNENHDLVSLRVYNQDETLFLGELILGAGVLTGHALSSIDAPQIKLRDQTANWPTMTSGNPSNANSKRGSDSIYGAVENWPTPNASTGGTHTGLTEETALKEVERGNQIGLGAAVALQNWNNKEQDKWPTPAARDVSGFDGPGKKNPSKPRDLYLSIHQDQETEKHGKNYSEDSPKSSQPFAKTGICSPKCRRLNPNFAEHLMGIPVGWTSVSGPLETELYRQWQRALLSYLRRN